MAIAANVTQLDDDIVSNILDEGQRYPNGINSDTNQRHRLQDHYLRDVASDRNIERLIAKLPNLEGEFRQRMIKNIGWRSLPAATTFLEQSARLKCSLIYSITPRKLISMN